MERYDLTSTSWHSYPSIFNLGHKAIDRLFNRTVIIEEKVDGSQFSFGYFPEKERADGMGLLIRSKGAMIYPQSPPGLFKSAVLYVVALKEAGRLVPNWTYRGEVLAKPKHNTLMYERVPRNHILIYDINVGPEAYLGIEARKQAAEKLDLETVPVLFVGETSEGLIRRYLDNISCLGGQKVEGVVIKPFHRDYFGEDRKLLMGKLVSEAFKEAHRRSWGIDNPTRGDVIERIIADLNNTARWDKAIIHLREENRINDSPSDIGLIIPAVQADILKENGDEIRDALFKAFWGTISRGVIKGLPEWYKNRLLSQEIEARDAVDNQTQG